MLIFNECSAMSRSLSNSSLFLDHEKHPFNQMCPNILLVLNMCMISFLYIFVNVDESLQMIRCVCVCDGESVCVC